MIKQESLREYCSEHEARDKSSDALELLACCHILHCLARLQGHMKTTELFPPEDDIGLLALTSLPTIHLVYYRNHYDLLVSTDRPPETLVCRLSIVEDLVARLSLSLYCTQVAVDEKQLDTHAWKERTLELFPQITDPGEFNGETLDIEVVSC